MPVQIPEDVANKIYTKAIKYGSETMSFNKGAYFGYQLSQQQLEEKEKEIERLKSDNDKLYKQRDALLNGKDISKKEIIYKEKQLQSFREKLSSITKDELLKNMNLPVELFDETFGIEK